MVAEGQTNPQLSIEGMVGQFEVLFDTVRATTQRIRFDPDNLQQLGAMALHATLLELARGITELIKVDDATCAPILLRSLLEAWVDLKNLVKDSSYVEDMRVAWLAQKQRLGRAALEAEGNPYLESLISHETLEEEFADVESELQDLKSRGHKPLKIRTRFERAGESDRYPGVYWLLCTRSHNNLNALVNRHVEQDQQGLRLLCFRPISTNEVQMYLDTAAGIIANSASFVKELAEGVAEGLEPVGRALEDLRALYPDPESQE